MVEIKFVNLTRHFINIKKSDGSIQSIPPDGRQARVYSDQAKITNLNGFDVVQTRWGTVAGVPEPSEGVIYITSSLVAMALPERTDIVTPNTHPRAKISDGDGNTEAVKSFQCFWRTGDGSTDAESGWRCE